MAIPSVNAQQVQTAVNTSVDEVENTEAPVATPNPSKPLKAGDSFGGVRKESAASANAQANGYWNAGDNTGNSAIDQSLDNFAQANAGNPAAISALENAASEVK